MASLEAFLAASSALHGVVSRIERSALDVRLAALAADPARRGELLVERALARANEVVTLADDAEVQPADERGQRFRVVLADLAPLAAAIAECQTAVDEMIAAPESATIDTGGSYRNYARDFVAAATLLRRAIETSQEFPDADDATEQVQDVIDAYNQVIDAYNRTRR